MPLDLSALKQKLEDAKKPEAIRERLVKMYMTFGYQIKPGDIFYKTMLNGEYAWGLKVGQYTHSCHVDTTEYIVLFILGYGHSELKGVPDIFLTESLTV